MYMSTIFFFQNHVSNKNNRTQVGKFASLLVRALYTYIYILNSLSLFLWLKHYRYCERMANDDTYITIIYFNRITAVILNIILYLKRLFFTCIFCMYSYIILYSTCINYKLMTRLWRVINMFISSEAGIFVHWILHELRDRYNTWFFITLCFVNL